MGAGNQIELAATAKDVTFDLTGTQTTGLPRRYIKPRMRKSASHR
jgi:cation transport ATPase